MVAIGTPVVQMTGDAKTADGKPNDKAVKVTPFALAKGGIPMGDQALKFAEGVFGRRFDDVRIHIGDEGDSIARKHGAKALAIGDHIYFAHNQYNPESRQGKALLAHELAHVVQTGGGKVVDPSARKGARASLTVRSAERQAEEVERNVFLGKPIPTLGHLTPGPVLLRKPGGQPRGETARWARQPGENIQVAWNYDRQVDPERRRSVAPERPPAAITEKYNVVGYTEVAYGVVAKAWGSENGPDGAYTTTTTMVESGGSSYDIVRVWALERRRSPAAFRPKPENFLGGLAGALGMAILSRLGDTSGADGKGRRPLSNLLGDVDAASAPAGGSEAIPAKRAAPTPEQAHETGVKIFASAKIPRATWASQMGSGGRLAQASGPILLSRKQRVRDHRNWLAQQSNPAAPAKAPATGPSANLGAKAPPQVHVSTGPQKGPAFQKVSANVQNAQGKKAPAPAKGPAPSPAGKPAMKPSTPAPAKAVVKPAAPKPVGGVNGAKPPKTGVKSAVKPEALKAPLKPTGPKAPGEPAKPAGIKSPAKPTSLKPPGNKPPGKPAGPARVQADPKLLENRPATGIKKPLPPKEIPSEPNGGPPAPKKLPTKPLPPKEIPSEPSGSAPVPAPKGLKRPLVKSKPAQKSPVALERPALKKRPPLAGTGKDSASGEGKAKAPAFRPPPAKRPNAPAFIRENAAKARVEPLGVQRPPGSSKRPLLARFLPRPVVPRMRLRRLLSFFIREPRRRKGFRAKNQRPLLDREVARTVKQGRRSLRTVGEIFNDVLAHKLSRAMASDDVPEAAPLPDFALVHYPGATGGATSAHAPTQGGAAGGSAGPRSGGFLGGLLGALKAGLSFASKRFAGTGFGSFAADSLHMITQGEGLAHAIEQAYGAFKGGGVKALLPKLSSVGEQAVSLKHAADPVLRMIGFRMSPQSGAAQIGDPRFEGAAEANERAVLRMLSHGQALAAGQAARGGTAAMGMVHRDARPGAPRIAGPVLVPASGGGEQLSGPARAYVEGFFGRSFADVRIHRGPSAVAAADRLSAHAFTAGRDIYFGRGEFRPETPKGMALLVHELTHVTQQGPGVLRKAAPGGGAAASQAGGEGGGDTLWTRMLAGMEAIAGPLMARLGGELAQAGINSASALIRAMMPRPAGVTRGDIDPSVGGGKVDRPPESDPIIRTQVEQGLAARAVALPGMPLPAHLRDKLEEEIDVDLSRVRLHTGRVATDVVEALGADAFAKGESVVLGEKAKADLSSGKLGTLAHELAHVRQHQRREHLGSRSPLAREVLEETAKEVERRMPTFSRVAGVGEHLLSEKMLRKVEEGLPEELELLRPRKRPQPTIEPEPKQEDDGETPDDGSNIIHQLMWYYGVRPQVGEEEFIDELTERVQDLMEEELRIERERKHVEAPF